MENDLLTRYAEIPVKNKREIVLLRGSGCKWQRCTFCDYHLDFSLDEDRNYALNQKVLQKVTGKYRRLEVINSGSFVDLDSKTIHRRKAQPPAQLVEWDSPPGAKPLHFRLKAV
mgnify:FL=1